VSRNRRNFFPEHQTSGRTADVESRRSETASGGIRTVSGKSLRIRGGMQDGEKSQPVLKERARNTVSMQERLLQEVIQKKKVISLILINGFHMKGIVKEYDAFSILVEFDDKNHLIYKHAISTIRL
jgi:host factor-I protein